MILVAHGNLNFCSIVSTSDFWVVQKLRIFEPLSVKCGNSFESWSRFPCLLTFVHARSILLASLVDMTNVIRVDAQSNGSLSYLLLVFILSFGSP